MKRLSDLTALIVCFLFVPSLSLKGMVICLTGETWNGLYLFNVDNAINDFNHLHVSWSLLICLKCGFDDLINYKGWRLV
jgi:hypothetical protein